MKKYENFCSALDNLKDIFNYNPPYTNVEITGLVGLYEICFDQSWKMMKEMLENAGYSESAIGSPKAILKTAFKSGMIDNEQLWLEALSARNNASHAYNHDIALDIIFKTKDNFYNMFETLKVEIENKWLLL